MQNKLECLSPTSIDVKIHAFLSLTFQSLWPSSIYVKILASLSLTFRQNKLVVVAHKYLC